MNTHSEVAPTGELSMEVTRGAGSVIQGETTHVIDPDPSWPALTLTALWLHLFPHRHLGPEVNAWRRRNLRENWRTLALGAFKHWWAELFRIGHWTGCVYLTKVKGDGTVVPLGLGSLRVVTTVGVGYLVDALQNIVEPENLKFHGYGTGTTAENVADTALVTELTTEYVVNSTRPTGTTTEGASGNIYRTVGTLTPDSGGVLAITEHGVFSASSAGVLLDRTKFAAVNLDSAGGDSLQTTYELTLTAGS